MQNEAKLTPLEKEEADALEMAAQEAEKAEARQEAGGGLILFGHKIFID